MSLGFARAEVPGAHSLVARLTSCASDLKVEVTSKLQEDLARGGFQTSGVPIRVLLEYALYVGTLLFGNSQMWFTCILSLYAVHLFYSDDQHCA